MPVKPPDVVALSHAKLWPIAVLDEFHRFIGGYIYEICPLPERQDTVKNKDRFSCTTALPNFHGARPSICARLSLRYLAARPSKQRTGTPFLAEWKAVSPSIRVAATAPSWPHSDHPSLSACHISMMRVGSKPLAIRIRADVIRGDAEKQSVAPSYDARHFRPLDVGVTMICRDPSLAAVIAALSEEAVLPLS
jgi:hypothetical protein